jgi:hypothetical protein
LWETKIEGESLAGASIDGHSTVYLSINLNYNGPAVAGLNASNGGFSENFLRNNV